MSIKKALLMVGVLALCPSLALAQGKTISKGKTTTATATIEQIDATNRTLMLKSENGEEDTYKCGPEIKRFSELKVGDKITMTYYESTVYQVRKPGEASNPVADTAALKRAEGALPGGTLAAQQTTTVTVKAVDPAAPSITVQTADGHTVTRMIEDKKNLEGLKPGDRIDITYTQALLTSVQRAPTK
jgi:Cu/Ag efflux protein CusF